MHIPAFEGLEMTAIAMTIYLSSKLTLFLELPSRRTVLFSEQITSEDKYSMIFPHEVETIVYMSNARLWNNRFIVHRDIVGIFQLNGKSGLTQGQFISQTPTK